MANAHITAREINLTKMLREGCFSVPWHQRSYDWEVSHVEDLLNDIEEAVKEKRSCHFISSIMLIERESKLWEINDGQQRIITFLLICAFLCQSAKDGGDDATVQRILSVLFNVDAVEDGKTMDDVENLEPRVTPSEKDKTNFHLVIRGRPINANGKMTKAWGKIVEFFDQPARQNVSWRKTVVDFLLKNILVVELKVDKSLDANAIFEVLNYRGKQLEDVDLIRNHIYSFFNHDDQSAMRETVRSSIELVYSSFWNAKHDNPIKDVSSYVRCHLQMRFGFLRESRFFRDVKQSIAHSSSDKKKREKIVFRLVEDLATKNRIELFRTLLRPSTNEDGLEQLTKHSNTSRKKRRIKDFLKDLNKYTITYPVQFAILCRYWESPNREQKVTALFAYNCYKYLAAFVQRIAHTQGDFKASSYEENMATLAMNINKGKCSTDRQFLEELKNIDKENIITDTNYINLMENITYSSSTSKAKYILARIVEHQQKDVKVADLEVSVEHVLPKGTVHYESGGWPEFDKDSRTKYVNRLGNFTLLHKRDNKPQERHNRDFDAKKAIFEGCSYDITRQLCDIDSWGPKNVEERQEKFADIAAQIWNFK